MAVTCYDVLAVGPGATDEEIETAFRRRARETHPDVSDHADAAERFRLLARARTTLRDDEERARYDRLGHDAYAERAWSEEFTATWLDVTDGWVTERADDPADDDPGPETTTDHIGDAGADHTAGAESDHNGDTGTDYTADTGTDHTASAAATAGSSASGRSGATASAAGADSATVAGGTGRTSADADDAGLWDTGSSWVDEDRDAGRRDTGGFGIRNVEPSGGGTRVSVVRPDETELLLTIALFIGYPFFLFGSVAPAFPLAINVTLGVLTLLLVGAALVRPAVGIGVFGAWSVVAPAVAALWNVDVGVRSVVLPVVVGTCLLPFAFALLVAYEYG
jgi:curved DNA-binding protein CbpA